MCDGALECLASKDFRKDSLFLIYETGFNRFSHLRGPQPRIIKQSSSSITWCICHIPTPHRQLIRMILE